MPQWQEAYPAVHSSLAPAYRDLPQDQVEAVLHDTFGEGFTLGDAEGFFDDVGRALSGAANAAAPVLQRALPGVVSGAVGGAALGPVGMLSGALLGGVGSALGAGAGGVQAGPASTAPGGARRVRPRPQAPAPAASGAGPTAAVAQLLAALGSPTVQQALSSMMLGRAGAPAVQGTAGIQVPVAAITNLIAMLAGQASAEWEAAVPSGEAEGFDVASPEVRSALLLEQLAPPDANGRAESDGLTHEAWLDDLYDELEAELFEARSEGGLDETVAEMAEAETWGGIRG